MGRDRENDDGDHVCSQCGLSHLLHRESEMLKARVATLEFELDECRDAAKHGLKWKAELKQLEHKIAVCTTQADTATAKYVDLSKSVVSFATIAGSWMKSLRSELQTVRELTCASRQTNTAVVVPPAILRVVNDTTTRTTCHQDQQRLLKAELAEERAKTKTIYEELTTSQATIKLEQVKHQQQLASTQEELTRVKTTLCKFKDDHRFSSLELKTALEAQEKLNLIINDLRKSLSMAEKEEANRKTKLDQNTNDSAKTIEKLNQEISQLQRDLSKANNVLTRSNNENEALRISSDSAGGKLASLSEECAQMRRKFSTAHQTIEAQTSEIKQQQAQLREFLELQVHENKTHTNTHRRELRSWKEQHQTLMLERDTLEDRIKTKDKEVRVATQALKSVTAIAEAAEKAQVAMQQENVQLRNKLNTALIGAHTSRQTGANTVASTRIRAQQGEGAYKAQVESLRRRLTDTMQEAMSLQEKLEMQNAEIRMLRETVAEECVERQSLTAALEKAKAQALGNHHHHSNNNNNNHHHHQRQRGLSSPSRILSSPSKNKFSPTNMSRLRSIRGEHGTKTQLSTKGLTS